jgi:hypothetical protein
MNANVAQKLPSHEGHDRHAGAVTAHAVRRRPPLRRAGRVALQERVRRQLPLISKTQKIITELSVTLKPTWPRDVQEALALYNFVYRKLIEANVEHELAPMDEGPEHPALPARDVGDAARPTRQKESRRRAHDLDMPAPDSRMEASISMQG